MIDTLEVAEELENLGFPEEQAKGLVRMENRLLVWMLSAMGVAVAIISIVTTYAH